MTGEGGAASSRSRAVEGPRPKITHSPEFSPDARCEYTRENIAYTTETSPQARAHVIDPLLSTVLYGTVVTSTECPVNRNVVFFSNSCGAGMRYGKKSSEFGIPRGAYLAWRARGRPLAVSETRTQYLAILSLPHSCSAFLGFFFRTLPL